MSNIHSVHKIYWQWLKYPFYPTKFKDISETQEIEPPYRHGSGFAFHLPFTKYVFVIGKWKSNKQESEALTYAIGGRIMEHDEVDWDRIIFGEQDESI